MTSGFRLMGIMAALSVSACVPRIELAMPKEPITINMNVRIEHDINITADKQSVTLLQPVVCPGAKNCPPAK
ncbi:YnbE family lipoprotein [Sodalis sp. dw_96]|uniref:YnbE family lipoprotein n=1 Tax=Sodalis sp. dw_96 TaxID=2719794 RepID=UPI001BD38585|nr:YnbE family lipoprotein [Sodalis sp. dw_96]